MKNRTLKKYRVGGLPIIRTIMDRLELRRILSSYLPHHGNEKIPAEDTLMLLIANLALGKNPLYELEEWVCSLDHRCIGDEFSAQGQFNDDRFGRALDKLYSADLSSLMTEIVVAAIKAFDLKLDRYHNDSTSVKAYGKISGETERGLKLKNGHSKDHRPDLKQLIYSLTISSDGAVPIHCKIYLGNRTDDTTHIETWEALRKIHGSSDFLYVADSKLCTDEQLSYIESNGGRAITIMPQTWGETSIFMDALRSGKIPRQEIWRRDKPGSPLEKPIIEYFYSYDGDHHTGKRNYRIHWIHSSEKSKRDRAFREERLCKTEMMLLDLNLRINARKLKTREKIQEEIDRILSKNKTNGFFAVDLGVVHEEKIGQVGRGRPGKSTDYRTIKHEITTMTWRRLTEPLKQEAKTDGVFPLLCTDEQMDAKAVLQAYKYQPRLEKRFSQFKSIHNAAPLFFKKIERVEANMYAFFIALMIQALIERQTRNGMDDNKITSLPLYPEDREASHPTTAKIMNIFNDISTYKLLDDGCVVEEHRDELNKTQHAILELFHLTEEQFWIA